MFLIVLLEDFVCRIKALINDFSTKSGILSFWNVVLSCESMHADEILKYDSFNCGKLMSTILSCGTVYCVVKAGSNFCGVCG